MSFMTKMKIKGLLATETKYVNKMQGFSLFIFKIENQVTL